MTSTNDGKEVKNNQTSSTKGKTYLIELYKSLEARLSEAGDASERTKHLCSAWRSVHSLCQLSAPSTQQHLLNWLPRHTARTVLQTSWQKPEREDDRRSLETAINDFIATASSSPTSGQASWEVALVSRGEWFKRLLESPWDHPVLTSLLNASGTPPTDDEVLTWLKEERGVTFVVRLHTLVGEKCDDIAVSLATAVMERVRAALPPADDTQEQGAAPVAPGTTFGEQLTSEAGFTRDVWDSVTDIEFVLLHKRDRQQCIALAKQTPLAAAYPLVERLHKRLDAVPHEKRLWKNARVVAILIAQVVIARCMVVAACEGGARKALYCCACLLARLLGAALPAAADALAAQAPTARHLHTMAFAVDKQLLPAHEHMRAYVCELYVRALTAGMNELERLKIKTEKESEARTMERTLASWFVQLGGVLSKSRRIACECTLTAFSLQPSQGMYAHIEAAPLLAPVLTDSTDPKEEPSTSEGSWANDSRSQTNLVKTSETLNLKQTQSQANVLSTAIFNEGEALGLSQMLCQDIAVLLAGPRVKTLSWDMDRTLLLENCRAYMEKTHGGTRLPTRELKYLNIDLKQYQHLPEEQDDDENDPYYGIERGYEHLAVLEEPKDIFPEIDPERTESASGIEDDYNLPRLKKKTKRIKADSSSDEDSGPLSEVAEAKRMQKKKERPHSKERSKERAKKKQETVDPLAPDTEKKEKPPKEKKERKKKERAPKVLTGKRTSLAKLLGLRVGNTRKRHKDLPTVAAPVTVTSSDCGSQGKNSLTSEGTVPESMEASWRAMYEATQKNRPITITTNKPKQQQRSPILSKMQYRPQYPNAPRPSMSGNLPSTHDGRTMLDNSKQHQDVLKANLNKILEFRRQKEMEKKLEAQTARSTAIQRPNIPPLQTNISPKAVVIPEIPKSYISKEQAERYVEMVRSQRTTDSVIQYAKNLATSKSLQPDSESGSKAQPNTNTLKMGNIVNTSYDRLMAEIAERHSKSQEAKPPQTQHKPRPSLVPAQKSYLTAGQRDFQNFLQNYERKSVMPHPDEISLKSKKPMPVSRVVPVVPNVPRVEVKPVASAKQPAPQKKPETTLNTFSRLSYMHKTKQNEMKNKAADEKQCETSTYQEVSTELDKIIKEHQQAQRRVIQAKRDRELFLKSQEAVKRYSPKSNPLLSNMLSDSDLTKRHDAQYTSNEMPQNLTIKSIVPPVTPTKTNSIPSTTMTTALSEKDQNELWNLLRQQSKMNNTSHYSSSTHSKPSAPAAPKPQPMTQFNTIGHNQQQPYSPNTLPVGIEVKSSFENKINVLSNTLLKPGCHEIDKSVTINVEPKTVNKSSDKPCNPIKKQDKVSKNASCKSAGTVAGPETPEWQSVMQDILKLKTPSRQSSIIELPPRQTSYESVFEKNMKKSSSTDIKTVSKQHEKVDRQKPVITSIQNIIITKKGVKLQDAPHPQKGGSKSSKHPINEKSKKATNESAKKPPHETREKQFVYPGPKHIDPFISGIPNSEYDLLDELMDDDLRKEIGELSSDEESYNTAAQSFLKPVKRNEKQRVSIQYIKCVNDASPPKPASGLSCLNTYQSSDETPFVTVKPVSQCANKISTQRSNKPQNTFSVDSLLASQNTARQIPSSTSHENQVCDIQNTKAPVLLNPNNIYMTAVPQQAPVQKVLLLGSDLLYGGYSTALTPVQHTVTNYAPNYIAVNNSPITLYQTQYATPVVIGASVSVPVINQVSSSVVSVVHNVQNTSTHINEHASYTQENLRADDGSQQNYKSHDEIKAHERKVLSEVQEYATTDKVDKTKNQTIENDINETIKKDLTADKERLRKKRLAILNRQIYHKCGEKTIALSYSPLPKTDTVVNHDISKVNLVSQNYNSNENVPDTEDEKLLAQIKSNLQDLSDAINEVSSPATPDSVESKENKNTSTAPCRRILLRSSNKMTSTKAVISETPPPKKTRAKSKSDITEPRVKPDASVKEPTNRNETEKRQDTLTEAKRKKKPKGHRVENIDLKPLRVSKRIRNKKIEKPAKATSKTKQPTNKVANNSQLQDVISPIELLDIESELHGSVITKSAPAIEAPGTLESNDDMTMGLLPDEVCNNIKQYKYRTECEDLQKPLKDIQVNEKFAVSVTESVQQNYETENISNITVPTSPTKEEVEDSPSSTINPIIDSITEVQNVCVSPAVTTDIEPDDKPVCLQTTEVKVVDKVQQIEEVPNDNIIGYKTDVCSTTQNDNICKNRYQYTSEITPNYSMIPETELDINLKSKSADSVCTPKLPTVMIKETEEINEIPKKTDTDGNENTDDANTMPKKSTYETETLVLKEDIDLDMSVTCDEISSTPSPVFGSVITATSKSINTEKKNNNQIIVNQIKPHIKQNNDNVSDVVCNDKEATSKPNKVDVHVTADSNNAETSGNETVSYIENVSVVSTPEKSLIPEIVTPEKPVKNQVKTLQTNKVASDNDDVVLIDDDDITPDIEVPQINMESNKPVVISNVAKTNSEDFGEINGAFDTLVTKQNKSAENLSGAKIQETHFKKVPQVFKDNISIEELPCDEPFRKKIRVSLPNGKKFIAKLTVQGHFHITYDTLFAFPSIRNALLNGLECKKLVATVDFESPKKILSAKVVPAPSLIHNNAQPVDTIDLLSDDEDNQTTNDPKSDTNEFVFETEIGKLKIPPMDKDLFIKHRKQLNQRSQILLERIDEKNKMLKQVQVMDSSSSPNEVTRSNMAPTFSKNTEDKPEQALEMIPNIISTPVPTDITATIPNQYVAGLMNDIQNNMVTTKVTPKLIPDVVEIDDSSNDSVDIIKSLHSKPEDNAIDILKNSLLQDLGAQFNSKSTINKACKEQSDDDDVQIIEPKLEVVKEIMAPAKRRSRRKVLQLSNLPTDKSCRFGDLDAEEQQQIKRRKCSIKLIRCDELAKIHEKEIEKLEDIPTPMVDDKPIVISEDFSFLDSINDDTGEERSSSPVIELFDVLVALDKTSLPRSVKIDEMIPLSCQASWLSTKTEQRKQCMNDAAEKGTTKKSEQIRKDCMMPLYCKANWLDTKFTTRMVSLKNTLPCENVRIDDEVSDTSMDETTLMTCEDTVLDQKTLPCENVRIGDEVNDSSMDETTLMTCEDTVLDQKTLSCENARIGDEVNDTSMDETTLMTCEDTVLDQKLDDTDIQLKPLVFEEQMQNHGTIGDILMSIVCEASWLTAKSSLHMELKYNTKSCRTEGLVIDYDKEISELVHTETSPVNCEANYLATKPMLHYQHHIFAKIQSDAYKCCDDRKLEVLMPLSCEADWLTIKPLLHMQRFDLIQHGVNITDHSEHVVPLFCNANWFETKAELYLQHINITLSRDVLETVKKTFNEITSLTSLSCEAVWFATKHTEHSKALNDALAQSTYLANSTLQIQTYGISNLTSQTLKVLQDANVINQYKLLQKCTNKTNAMLLKRRLLPLKKPTVSKLRKLNNETSISIQINSKTIDTTANTITNISESMLDDKAVNIVGEIRPVKFEKTLESLEYDTLCYEKNGYLSNSSMEINSTQGEKHEDLQDSSLEIIIVDTKTSNCDKELHISSPVLKTQEKIASCSPSPIIDTRSLPFEIHIPSSRAPTPKISTELEDDKLQSVETENTNNFSAICAITDSENSICSVSKTESDKRLEPAQTLSSNYDDLEANLAEILGESLAEDENKNNAFGDSKVNTQSKIRETLSIHKPEDESNKIQTINTSNYCLHNGVSLEETIDDIVKDDDGKILECSDAIEVEVIVDWETEIVDTSMCGQINQCSANQDVNNSSEENNKICMEESIAKLDHMYYSTFVKGIQPMYENMEDHVVFYVPTESLATIVLSENESSKDLEEEIVDIQSDEIVDDLVIANNSSTKIYIEESNESQDQKIEQFNYSNARQEYNNVIDNKSNYNKTLTCLLVNKNETNANITRDDIEEKLVQIFGEPVMNGDAKKNSKNSSYKKNLSPLSDLEGVDSQLDDVKENKESDYIHSLDTENMVVLIPNRTYAKYTSSIIPRRRSLKRKMNMSDTKTRDKKYRKAKNIDYPKFKSISFTKTLYTTEFQRVFDYSSSLKFSYSVPFHKDMIDVHDELKAWPILNTWAITEKTQIEVNKELFEEIEKPKPILDPLLQTLDEEINSEFDETSYTPSNVDTNFSVGFGERSGRVIQESIDGEHTPFSAATLSDVKQLQPLLPSDVKETPVQSTFVNNIVDQKLKAKRFVDHFNLRARVRAFFEKSKAELYLDLKQNKKKRNFENDCDSSDWPFDYLTSTRCFRPPPVDITVNVVQVGQLPVSAAAQNPVTCDPRVTHVSNASPSQCSPENSIGDELQTPIKTEYTELTTADITLPMMQEYVTQHHSMPTDSQEQTNAFGANNSMSVPSDMKSVVKIELMEETSADHQDDNMNYENSGAQQLSNGNIGSNMQYHFENPTNIVMAESSSNTQTAPNSAIPKTGETFSENKQTNDVVEKSDQLANAMNAAGIPANKTLPKPSNSDSLPQNIPNVTISQPNTNNFPKTTPINAIALQQALAQILPPSLNQGNTSDTNPQTSGNPQVLHIVQGNNSQSVINKPNGTQLLHIVQNKSAVNSNGVPVPQQNTFSGLSLVDGSLQQGGNQLLHIVNAANQKNANAGQLLKRVNLLTNLANVQGSNEQKMVQFLCKSADGKSIQLPHQRSMVLRLQPLDPTNVPTTPKQNDNQELASSSGTSHSASEKESSPQEMKSRSLYEENYAKFVQSDVKFAQNGDQKLLQEKATSLPKFNQVFGKQVYQDKQDELETENCQQNPEQLEENNPPMEQMNDMTNPQMLIRKPNQTQPTLVQPNLVQQIKQTIGPMNIQTMHGGVIYTRQIPVNIGNGQTINLITVPSTELVDDSAQKQQADGKFNQEGDPPIIKLVPTNQATTANGAAEDNNSQLKSNNDGSAQPNPQPQPQTVLTQMRIKLPMLSKAPQMVGGTRVVRPSFFQIQRNVIGGANQQVYQQLVLTAAPPIGQSIRLPAQVQKPKIPSETQSSAESQMSSSTLEQLREFDMVLEQVKERSTVQPGSSGATNNFSKLKGSPDTTDAPKPSTSTQESPTQVLYSVGNSQTLNMVNYVTRKSTITSTTTTSFVRSPDSTGTVESPSSSTHSHLPHTVTSDSCASSCASEAAASTASQPKPKKKKPKPSTSNSNPFNIKNTPKPSSQKPLEDEQTTQRILYILAEYKEQVENSPDKDKPAPRRRNNPAAPNAGSSKRKKSSSGSRRRDMSPVMGEDSCRTMGSEDSSCGTSLGECNECLETHSPEESPKKVVRRLTFEQETQITQTRTTTTTTTAVPQRNVIVTDGQAFAVRGATGKPATTVLMPANYLLPVSMVKGGQQIAIVTNRGPKLLVGAGEGGTGGTLLFQRLIGPGGLKPVIARPGVRHIRLPTAALHNLQTFNIAAPASTVPPPDSTASPAPAPAPPDLVDTRAMSSPWPDRDAGEIKPERGNSSPEGSEPWNLPSSSIADDYGYEEIVRTDNMDRTVLDAIPDRYSPDLEAQRIFDKMFDSDSKKSMYDSRCSYDIDASDDDKNYQQVVHRKDGRHTTRLTHVSAAALRHKYAILEHELRLQKSLSEECEDLGVDSPSASELFPEAELLFAPSPAHEQTIDQCHTPQPTIHSQGIPHPDLDDQIATDQLLTHKDRPDELDINLDDVGEIVTVGEDGMTTIPLDHEEFARSHEEFARSHPNTTFHSEPEDGEVPPFTIAQGVKGRQITFHPRGVPGTVVMAPQTTVISQATVEAAGSQSTVKFSDIDNMINAMPSPQHANLNMPSVLVKDGNETMTKFDRLLNESREMSPNMTSNPASAIVHSTGNGTQVIRRVQYENRRDSRFLGEDSDAMIGGDTKMTEERRELPLDENSSERHPELFWDQSRADRKRFDFSSDSEKCCKSPYDETNSDSSGVGAHTRLDSVIKAARPERRRSDGSSAEESHPPLRTYPAKRSHQHAHHSHHHADVDRSLTGKTRATDSCHNVKDESRRRASNRGVVKRGCHCCNGSSAPPKPKKSRPKKSNEFTHN